MRTTESNELTADTSTNTGLGGKVDHAALLNALIPEELEGHLQFRGSDGDAKFTPINDALKEMEAADAIGLTTFDAQQRPQRLDDLRPVRLSTFSP